MVQVRDQQLEMKKKRYKRTGEEFFRSREQLKVEERARGKVEK
jgi:hypothetical protein